MVLWLSSPLGEVTPRKPGLACQRRAPLAPWRQRPCAVSSSRCRVTAGEGATPGGLWNDNDGPKSGENNSRHNLTPTPTPTLAGHGAAGRAAGAGGGVLAAGNYPPPPRSPQPPTPAASQGTVSPQVSEFKNQNGLYGRTLRRNAMEATKPSLHLFAASLLTGSLFAVSQELRHRAVDTRPSAGLTPRPVPLRFFRVSFRFEKIYRVTV